MAKCMPKTKQREKIQYLDTGQPQSRRIKENEKKKKKDSSDRVKSERKNTQNNTHKLRRFVKCINVFFFLFDRVY